MSRHSNSRSMALPDSRQQSSSGSGEYGQSGAGPPAPQIEKEQPNFGLSGKLTEETNTFRGVVIKYSEPPEARKPQRIRWRLYPFKGQEALPVMYIHRQSAYLLGRERKIADIPIDHPSCSKQHAVIQFRLMPYERSDGSAGRRIKPYIIDLESANGTMVNGNKIEPKRYVELFEKDVLKFGFSSREYVLLNEQSKDNFDDDEEEGMGVESSPEPQGSKESTDLLPIKNEPSNPEQRTSPETKRKHGAGSSSDEADRKTKKTKKSRKHHHHHHKDKESRSSPDPEPQSKKRGHRKKSKKDRSRSP